MVDEGRRVEIVQHSDVNADVVTIANSRVLELGSTYTEVVKRLHIDGHQQTSVRIKGLELLVDSSWRFYSRCPAPSTRSPVSTVYNMRCACAYILACCAHLSAQQILSLTYLFKERVEHSSPIAVCSE